MAIPRHKSIKFLQAQTPRLRDLTNEIVNIISSTVLQYKVDSSNPTLLLPSNSPIKLIATSARDGGIFAWEIVGAPVAGVSLGTPTGTRDESVALEYTNATTVDTVTVKVVHTTPPGVYPTSVAEKQVVLTKQGPAQSTRTLTLYKEATGTAVQPIAPTAPTGSLKYRFSDDTYPVNTTGWSTSAPTSPSLPVYFIQRNISTYSVTSTYMIDVLADWTTPANITQQGVSPPLINLSTTGYAFLFNDVTQTVQSSPDIVLTAAVSNTPDTVTWAATAYNSANVSLGNITSINGTSGTTKTLTSQQFTLGGNVNVKYVKITATVGQLQDTITIYRGDNGADQLILWLQNESHNIPQQVDGLTYDLTGATTIIRVFKGWQDITQQCTFTATTLTGTVGPSIIGGTSAEPTYTVTSLGTDVATVAIRTTYNSVNLEKVFTITKSKQGASQGVVFLNQSGGIFTQDSSGAVQPTQINLTTTISNITAPVYSWYKDGALISGAVQSQYEVSQAQVLTQATYTVKVTGIINGTSSQVREDSTTLARVVDGQDAISVVLSNESHTLPADKDGNVTSYAGSGTTIKVYRGATELNYDGIGTANQSWTFQTQSTNITVGSVIDSGTFATVGDASGVQAGTDTASITFTITGKSSNGVQFSITKQQQFSKSRAGANGANGAVGPQGAPGTDAAVTAANVAAAIQGNSSIPITMANSHLFQTQASPTSPRVFIGSGGITGTTGQKTTFAIQAATGEAIFSGKITGAEIDIDTSFGSANGLSFKNAGVLKGGIHLGQYGTQYSGTVLETKLDEAQAATHILATNKVGGTYYTSRFSVTSSGGFNNFTFEGPQGGAFIQQGGGNLSLAAANGFSAADVIITAGAAGGGNIDLGQYAHRDLTKLKIHTANVKILDTASGEVRFIGTAPKIVLDKTAGQTTWHIKHEAPNLVFSYNNTSNDLVLDTSGNLTARGNVTAYSDKAIKSNIRPISRAINKLKQINGYHYKNLLANNHDCGIIAQEIEKILPELVQVGSTEYEGTQLKTVNYNGVVALLVAANRELITRVEALEKQLHDTTSIGPNKPG